MKKKFIVATSNSGKFEEIKDFFKHDFVVQRIKSKKKICEEIHDTFLENALLKARHVSRLEKMPVISDDSGILIESLDGLPGVRSARLFSGQTSMTRDEANNIELLKIMKPFKELEQRKAFFVCVAIAIFKDDDPLPAVGVGTWHGRILSTPVGNNGHGYDPLFYCPVAKKTSAQMTLHEKKMFSHRGKALKNLREQLFTKNF